MDNVYEDGRAAYHRGQKKCPYIGERKTRWWNGYYDARTEDHLGWTRESWGDKNQRERELAAKEDKA